MNRNLLVRGLSLFFCLGLLMSAEADVTTNAVAPPLKPGPNSGRIAFVTMGLLQELQYLQQPFDSSMASKFLNEYLDTLDPQHLYFLQSDVDEFQGYHNAIAGTGITNTAVAYTIFSRLLERLHQREIYAEKLLKTGKFDFNTDETIAIDRHEAPWPKNLDEARQLWRQRVRYDYLMQKLSLEDPSKTNAPVLDAHGKPEPVRQQIVEKLTHNYRQMLHLFGDFDSNDVLEQYLDSLARTYDPHSDYQGPLQYEDFAMQMNLSLSGIGAQLKFDDGYCKIAELLNGPAMKSKKISVGDRIVAVAQSNQPPVDIVDMPLTKAVQLIRGPKGTEVRLTIIPANASNPNTHEVVSLIRDEIKLENGEAKGQIIEEPGDNGRTVRLGVIDLPSFYATIDDRTHPTPRSTSADVAKLLKKFNRERVAGVILDLRRNGGGSLEEAIKLTGLFIKKGPVVQIRHSNGDIIVEEDTDPTQLYKGPLMVLTSRGSASASEIVAGALQDYGRAIIVGDVSTFGKGTAQGLFPLKMVHMLASMTNNPGTLKITSSKFYRPSGASTELKGVVPDIVLPSLWNVSSEIGESTLDNHLPWDTIPSADFHRLNLVQPYLPELIRRSEQRVATNRDFTYIEQDITQFEKLHPDKTVSLNEQDQLRLMREADARKKAREAERLARSKPRAKIYEITLENVNQPGLPAPVQPTNLLASVSAAPAGSVGTNSVSASADTPADDDLGADDWRQQAELNEAEHIMLDYISLESNGKPIIAQTPRPGQQPARDDSP